MATGGELRHCLGDITAGDRVCFVGTDRRIVDHFGPRFTVEKWTEASTYPALGVALCESAAGLVIIRRDGDPA